MTDKITPIGTGYNPANLPPTVSDVEDFKLSLAIILDELEVLSRRITQLTKIVRSNVRKG